MVSPGQEFGLLVVQTPGSRMQRVFCLCRGCGVQVRVIAYCLVNRTKTRCETCERTRDTTWQAPCKWANGKPDPRNAAILAARALKVRI